MFKRIRKAILRFTPIRHEYLIKSGFETHSDKLWYSCADLVIYVRSKKYFYITLDGRRKEISNMLQVSDLVYGNTEYLS